MYTLDELNNRACISSEKFSDLNFLPVSKTINQCVNVIVFRQFSENCLGGMEDSEDAPHIQTTLRNTFKKIKQHIR